MYHTINEFLNDWKLESESTLKILSSLTDESLNYRVAEFSRTIGLLAWHIFTTIRKMLATTDIDFPVKDEINIPLKSEEIVKAYRDSSDLLLTRLPHCWNDHSLNEEVMMYGETWTKEMVLTSLIKHQIHHRAQLTVIMRAAGLKVPGIYGPSYEEWQQYGMKAPM